MGYISASLVEWQKVIDSMEQMLAYKSWDFGGPEKNKEINPIWVFP